MIDMVVVLAILIVIFFTYAIYYDVKDHKIPNKLIIALFATVLSYRIYAHNWATPLLICAVALLIGFLFYFVKIFGAGDAKLMAVVALMIGTWFGFCVFLTTLILLTFCYVAGRYTLTKNKSFNFVYAPFIVAAFFISNLFLIWVF